MFIVRQENMVLSTSIILAYVFTLAVTGSSSFDKITAYWERRERILNHEQNAILGHSLKLTPEEITVNEILMSLKAREINASFSGLDFPPSKNFLISKKSIEESDVFGIIKLMPKGAALHVHGSSLASVTWVVSEITYWDHLYMCYSPKDQLILKFMKTPEDSCNWRLVSDVRSFYQSAAEFDKELLSKLSIVTDTPSVSYPDLNTVWRAFESSLNAMSGILRYRPALEAYIYQALIEFVQDNVLYMEFRGNLNGLYELDGRELTETQSLEVYQATCDRFLADHKANYFGTRFIYGPPRSVKRSKMWANVAVAKQLKKTFPRYMAGFDLVAQEDLGLPLKEFLGPLLTLSEGESQMPFFFHAGETNWMGMDTDENLIDALLLNTTRIGHGYAIVKHPEAKRLALEMDVPLEVCPISNQVLNLISDLRNHPASILISEGFPIIISGDGRGSWEADPLSHDFYEAFMALSGAKADLRFLKQLAINSIKYSSLDDEDKAKLMKKWQSKWNAFITTVGKVYSYKDGLARPNDVHLHTDF